MADTQSEHRFVTGAHPNSLATKALNDPELKARIEAGRKGTKGDLAAMEFWAQQGFGGSIQPETLSPEAYSS